MLLKGFMIDDLGSVMYLNATSAHRKNEIETAFATIRQFLPVVATMALDTTGEKGEMNVLEQCVYMCVNISISISTKEMHKRQGRKVRILWYRMSINEHRMHVDS